MTGGLLHRIGFAAGGREGRPAPDSTGRKNLLLLVQLRWLAVAGQVATMMVVHYALEVDLPVGPMVAILAAQVALNLASLARLWYRREATDAEITAALFFDVAALTAQLYLTGGAENPFTLLYLVQVTLGAVLLEAWSTWPLVAVTAVCFAALTSFSRPLHLEGQHARNLFELHLNGMLIAFVLDATLVVIFVARVTRNLRERDSHLANLRQNAAEEDHIVRMGLLASGAAHELGTPLATLSVIVGDWRRMPALMADPELSQDIESMATEVQRCKAIVTGILMSAGEARGESAGVTTVLSFLDELVEDWSSARGGPTLTYENAFGADMAIASDTALKQVLFNVLDNALEASPHWVGFRASRMDEQLVLAVTDRGPGFPPGMLAQIGKPYQSSKGKRGGGLGLFLVVNVVRKLGGRVQARNRPEGGAEVTLTLPLEAMRIDPEAPDAG